jgi:hypothetical protein
MGYFRTRHFAASWGYQFGFDTEAGFTLCMFARRYIDSSYSKSPRYKLIIEVGWNWRPTVIWRDKMWHLNESGMLKGMPVARQKPLSWWSSIERIYWDRAMRWEWLPDG